MLILHPDTAHMGSRNIHPAGNIRVMVYFRIKSNGILPVPVLGNTPIPVPVQADLVPQSQSQSLSLSWNEIVEKQRTEPYFDLPGLYPYI